MLYLIGLGLNGIEGLTIEGYNAIKHCEKIYLEAYTSINLELTKEILEKEFNKRIFLANRKKIEEGIEEILEEAKRMRVCILVYGDPLIATTHFSIYFEAINRGIEVKIIHNVSIVNLLSRTGLFFYKFGKIASIPLIRENYNPTSFYDIFIENYKINAHTLFLLEVESLENYVSPKEALERLLEIDKKREKVLREDSIIIVLSRLGQKNEKIVAGKIKDLIKKDFGIPPHSIIIPAKLNEIEKEFLKLYII